jgi:hypothetical protein
MNLARMWRTSVLEVYPSWGGRTRIRHMGLVGDHRLQLIPD